MESLVEAWNTIRISLFLAGKQLTTRWFNVAAMKPTTMQAASTTHSSASPPRPPPAPFLSSMDSPIEEWKLLKVSEAENEAMQVENDTDSWPTERLSLCLAGSTFDVILHSNEDVIAKAYEDDKDDVVLAYLVAEDAGKLFGLGQVMDIPGAAHLTHYCAGAGAADKIHGDTLKISRDFQGSTLRKLLTKGSMRPSKVVMDSGIAWLENSKKQSIFLFKIVEDQKLAYGGPENIKCNGILSPFVFVMHDGTNQANFPGPFETLPNEASSELGWEFPIYPFFWGLGGPDVVNFVKNWWDGRASIAGIAKTICFDTEESLMVLAAGSIITDDALAALAGCVNSLANNDGVCFKALWCISILHPEFGESGRDHPLQCFSESFDPSVNGCISRQRRLRGGWAEASNALCRILSFKSFDDYLIFRIPCLYFFSLCNRQSINT